MAGVLPATDLCFILLFYVYTFNCLLITRCCFVHSSIDTRIIKLLSIDAVRAVRLQYSRGEQLALYGEGISDSR